MKKVKELTINFINGACMSMADSVPGVSGGTVAFILGFYEKFISSLDNLFRGTKEERKTAFIYLIKVGIGWIFGLLISIYFLANIFDHHIYEMSSLFIGFIVFAIPIVIKEEKKNLKKSLFNILFLLLGAGFVVLITYLNRVSGTNFNIDSFNAGTILYVFFAAALAISAMILPGISGSTLLLIFGIYIPIVTKVKELVLLNFTSLPIIIVFILGVIFGVIFFTRMLKTCLEKYRSATDYTIIGMMLASIYSIIMGPTTLSVPKSMLSFSTFNIMYFVLGGIIILSLEGLKYLLKSKE